MFQKTNVIRGVSLKQRIISAIVAADIPTNQNIRSVGANFASRWRRTNMKRLLLVISLCLPSWGAFHANTQWETRTTGLDTNGGGFAYGLGGKTVTAATDLVVNGANNKIVTSATHNFVAGDVNRYINVTA